VISIQYPTRVAAVEMHVDTNPSFPYHNHEARARMYFYAPPYYGGYATPWLWYDGNHHGSYTYATWRSKIVSRMNQPSPVTLSMWGYYSFARGSGTIYAKFRNDSTATLRGRVIWVITEDSLYFVGPNGDAWHNHVARDYLPTQNGQSVIIAPGDSVTLNQPFTIQSGWNASRCKVLTWIQDTVMKPDSTKQIWQGGIKKISELIGVEEEIGGKIPRLVINPIPNPCIDGTKFNFNLSKGIEYRIEIFDVTGRKIKTLSGTASGSHESINWNRRDDKGALVGSGVYLYRFESKEIKATGKIAVK